MVKLFTDRWVQFRMKVVQEARLSGKPMTQVAREFGLSRPTVYSYLDRYNKGGPEALKNKPRGNSHASLTPEARRLVVELKAEKMFRSCRKISEILREECHIHAHPKAVWRELKAQGMSRGILPDKKPIKPFVKKAPNELWQIDYMEDEPTAIGKVQLVYCLDDYSRSITGGGWFFSKSEGNALKVLKEAFKNNGLPKAILSDNGSQFKPTSKHEAQTRYQEIMAMLGIDTSYSRPYHPQSKGKIERLHSFIQRDFLWEVRDKVRSLEDLNRRWQRWVTKYNGYSHSSLTAQEGKATSPSQLYVRGRAVDPSLELDLLFAEEEPRRVASDSTIGFRGRRFKLPAQYIGCKVWLRVLDHTLQILYGKDDKLVAQYPLSHGDEAVKIRVSNSVKNKVSNKCKD